MKSARRAVVVLALSVLPVLALRPGSVLSAGTWQQASRAQCVFDHFTLSTAHGRCRPRARAYPAYVSNHVRRSIYDSALTFGIPYPVLLKIAKCESGLNPRAAYRGHFGLYQFLPETFLRGARDLRSETGVAARSYWNPLDSSYVAGFLFATGQSRSWACEKLAVVRPTG
jgi:hypothetical protein